MSIHRLIEVATEYADRTALVDDRGAHSYRDLLDASQSAGARLLRGKPDLGGARIGFIVAPGFDHVAVQWGIWRAGGIAVPLGVMHPPPELAYVIDDAQVGVVVSDSSFAEIVRPLAEARSIPFMTVDQVVAPFRQLLPEVDDDRRAMILYTSGTTGKPKGVVTRHATIRAQAETLMDAWAWTPDDRILHILPLHHVHGIINVLTCALMSGAKCEFQRGFDANRCWDRMARGDLSLFMAVPTVYSRLIAAWNDSEAADRARYSAGCKRFRLMVSGSAALPVSTLETWREISGHTLLERYGMTEIGMALSNPYDGERVPGRVGVPLPGVSVRRVDEAGQPATDDQPGEIEVRGASVFGEYWNRPEATRDSFHDGWFRTGDIAVVEGGSYRILGRSSVDIIKTGGYKVSALEIEEVLRFHPRILECAVVGVEDAEWGEAVCAGLVLCGEEDMALDDLRAWAKERLAVYKVPARIVRLTSLPRNAMGKVQKPVLRTLFEKETPS